MASIDEPVSGGNVSEREVVAIVIEPDSYFISSLLTSALKNDLFWICGRHSSVMDSPV